MQTYDLIVRGGTIVNGQGRARADICVRGGRIEALTLDTTSVAKCVIDARHKLVLPGVIDSHVHMQLTQQDKYQTADDFASGTRAAAAGGITTILDFFQPGQDGQPLWDAFQARKDQAGPQVLVDYGLHAVLVADTILSAEIDRLIDAGVTSFKLFQVYGRMALSDVQLYEALELVASRQAMATLHAENGQIADMLTYRLRTQAKTSAIHHAHSRPAFVEADCIQTAVNFSRAVGANLYIVHLSTQQGVDAVIAGLRAGARVLAETCPHYLVLDETLLDTQDGNLFLCTPPLRPRDNQPALWHGLREGPIHVAATDHCCFLRAQKLGARAFYQAPSGVGSVELLLPILYSEGVCRGRISLERLVQVLCRNPATVFGLADRKGHIVPGADADMVILDPEASWVVDSRRMHGKDDYSIYEGMRLQGRVEATVSRGEIIYRKGEILGIAGRGRFLERSLPDREALNRLLGAGPSAGEGDEGST